MNFIFSKEELISLLRSAYIEGWNRAPEDKYYSFTNRATAEGDWENSLILDKIEKIFGSLDQ